MWWCTVSPRHHGAFIRGASVIFTARAVVARCSLISDRWTVSSSLLPGTLWGIHDSGLKTLARTMSARVGYDVLSLFWRPCADLCTAHPTFLSPMTTIRLRLCVLRAGCGPNRAKRFLCTPTPCVLTANNTFVKFFFHFILVVNCS
jgi:hypothetical protein